jgi:hypothetical protein
MRSVQTKRQPRRRLYTVASKSLGSSNRTELMALPNCSASATISLLVRRVLIICAISLYVGCEERERSPEELPEAFDRVYRELLVSKQPLECFATTLVRSRATPTGGYIWAQACLATESSSVAYAYRTQDGKLLIAGRTYSHTSDRLLWAADSLTLVLDSLLGKGAPCPRIQRLEPWVVRHVYWHGDGFAVMLVASTFDFGPYVAIEAHIGTTGCSDYLGRPYDVSRV